MVNLAVGAYDRGADLLEDDLIAGSFGKIFYQVKSTGLKFGEDGKRLRRVLSVIKQA